MQEYKLKVLLTKGRSYVVIISEKKHDFWCAIGSFTIRDQKLLVADKHENWKKADTLTNSETLWEISLEKIAGFFKITEDVLTDIPDSDFITNPKNGETYIPIYVTEY